MEVPSLRADYRYTNRYLPKVKSSNLTLPYFVACSFLPAISGVGYLKLHVSSQALAATFFIFAVIAAWGLISFGVVRSGHGQVKWRELIKGQKAHRLIPGAGAIDTKKCARPRPQ